MVKLTQTMSILGFEIMKYFKITPTKVGVIKAILQVMTAFYINHSKCQCCLWQKINRWKDSNAILRMDLPVSLLMLTLILNNFNSVS